MRIAPSGRFSSEAREPDQHHRSIWLLPGPRTKLRLFTLVLLYSVIGTPMFI
jgi:hypothetical protein